LDELPVSLGKGGSRDACEWVIWRGEGSEGSVGREGGREGSSGGGSREDKTKKGLEVEGRDSMKCGIHTWRGCWDSMKSLYSNFN